MTVVLGAVLLAGSLGLGYVAWIRPHEARLDLHTWACSFSCC
jgi:hypothetical protein